MEVGEVDERSALAPVLIEMAADAAVAEGSPLRPARVVRGVLDAIRWSAHAKEDLAASEQAAWLLVSRWAEFGEPVRKQAMARARGRISAVLAKAARDERASVREGAATVVTQCAEAVMLPLAVDLLSDADESVVRAAEAAVLAVARASGESVEIEAELARAAAAYEHHRKRSIVELAIQRLPAGVASDVVRERSPLARWVCGTDSPASGAVRSVLRSSSDPETRKRAFDLLVVDGLVPAAADRLNRPAQPAEHVAVLSASHLVGNPRREKALRAIAPNRADERAGGILPALNVAVKLNEPARAGIPVLSGAMKLPAPARSAWTNAFINDASARVRWRAVRACARRDLGDFAFDSSEPVARAALLAWSSLGDGLDSSTSPEPLRMAGLFARSPHSSVRAVGEAERDRLAWDDPNHVAGRVLARMLTRRDRAVMVGDLRQRLASAEPVRAPSVAMLIRKLGLEREFASELAAMATAAIRDRAAARAAATAVAVLERAPGETARAAIETAAHSEDPRVRANAADAISKRSITEETERERALDVLVELKRDAHHRVKASALRGIAAWATAEGLSLKRTEWSMVASGLIEMLERNEPEQRVAGLWLAQRTITPLWAMGEIEVLSQAVARSARDPDERVRRRGISCSAIIAAIREQAELEGAGA